MLSLIQSIHQLLDSFAIAYFQVPWAVKSGGLMVFGVEAAQVIPLDKLEEFDSCYRLVIGMFFIAVPMTQLKGSYFRVSAVLSSVLQL
jgi:hypothetical protein